MELRTQQPTEHTARAGLDPPAVLAFADTMSTPGAMMSGLMRPSVVGPTEEKLATFAILEPTWIGGTSGLWR